MAANRPSHMRGFSASLAVTLALAVQAAGAETRDAGVESATRRGLARVQQAAADWQTHKTCFSCHHQTLPMLAALEAAQAGFPLDKAWLKSQADTSLRYFEERTEEMDAGDHIPGGAATTGFGFWALSLAQRPADPTTTSMVNYLLQIQGVPRLRGGKAESSTKTKDGRW